MLHALSSSPMSQVDDHDADYGRRRARDSTALPVTNVSSASLSTSAHHGLVGSFAGGASSAAPSACHALAGHTSAGDQSTALSACGTDTAVSSVYCGCVFIGFLGCTASTKTMVAMCTRRRKAMSVQAHGKPMRSVNDEPISGPSIWPREKEEAMSDERPIDASSALCSPTECIISSITGVIDIASPTPKSSNVTTICDAPMRSSCSNGLGPISRKPSNWRRRPRTMTARGPMRSRLARMPITGHDSVYAVIDTENRAPMESGEEAIPRLLACSPSVGSRKA
mmetsp:Transcript_30059/g.77884  ORF Transcript_30059/g.77884 Transcript_30059/m.77884 type:complete len:282 (-) Transcript_30059:957-1802(-)